MSTLATVANMRRFEERHPRTQPNVEPMRAIAYSPGTGEEYSATSGDYWNQPDDAPLLDHEGEPMLLVVRGSRSLVDAFDWPPPAIPVGTYVAAEYWPEGNGWCIVHHGHGAITCDPLSERDARTLADRLNQEREG